MTQNANVIRSNSELNSTFRWLGGILITIILTCVGGYASYMGTEVKANSADIVDLKINQAHFDGDLQVLDSKLDLVIDMLGGKYNGPAFHKHNESKDGTR